MQPNNSVALNNFIHELEQAIMHFVFDPSLKPPSK